MDIFDPRRAFAVMVVALALAASSAAQCHHLGSVPVPATWERSPSRLGCPYAPDWPEWHLFTPAHRQPAAHTGFDPGNATPLPRVLVTWRCTGLLLVPAVVDRVRTMGYVVDQPEVACAPGAVTS